MARNDDTGRERLLTSADVARIFRVDPRTVNRWVRSGRLTPAGRTPGGHLRFRETEVRDLFAGRPARTELTHRNGAITRG